MVADVPRGQHSMRKLATGPERLVEVRLGWCAMVGFSMEIGPHLPVLTGVKVRL